MDMFNPIPLDEAAAYFLRLRGREKTASIEETYVVLAELSPQDRQMAIKEAMEKGASAEDLALFLAAATNFGQQDKTASAILEKVAPGTGHVHSEGMLAALEQLPGRVFYSEYSKVASDLEKNASPPSLFPRPGNKVANDMGMGAMAPPAPLPPTGMGKNTVAPMSPPSLPATAMGQNKVATDKDPHAVGKERAHAALSAEFEKNKHHSRESIGDAAGRLGGLALGAYGGSRAGGGVSTVAGAALGQHVGGHLGRAVGAARDTHAWKKHEEKDASARFKLAFEQMGLGGPETGLGSPHTDPSAVAGQSPSAPDEAALEQYLAQEQEGGNQEQAGAAAFYQQKFQEAQAQLQQAQEQMQQSAQTTEQLQQQVAGSDEQIQAAMQQAQMAQSKAMENIQQASQMATDATNQALEFQADGMRQKQLAAAMRMGVQQMKDGIMGAMAQDPTDQLAQQLQSPAPGSAGMVGGAPMSAAAEGQVDPAMAGADASQQAGQGGTPTQGPADQAAAPAPQPTSAPPPGAEPAAKSESKGSGSESTSKGTTKVEVKQASFSVPHAVAGGVIGGGIGAGYSQMNNDPLRQQVGALEAMPEKGFGRAMQLATAKIRLAVGELSEEHPVASTLMGAAHGAYVGGMQGPEMVEDIQHIGQKMRGAYQNLRGTG